MSNKTYDLIKAIALLLAPIITLLGSIVTICNVPYAAQITAVLASIDTCLGSVVVIANKLYKQKEEGREDG